MNALSIPVREDNLINILSHDLREPARLVSQFLKLAQLKLPDNLDKDAEQYLEMAMCASEKLDGMIKGLVLVNEAKSIEDSRAFFNLKLLAESIATRKIENAKSREIEFNFSGPEEVFARRKVVKEVLLELIQNSIIHSDATSSVIINVECVQNSETLEIIVSNSGSEVNEFWCKHSFDLFQKANKNSSNYGVGLTRLKAIIESYCGEIWMCTSECGFTSVHCRIN